MPLGYGEMIKIRNDLCLGCGLCARSCPSGAISIHRGYAIIDANLCNQCGLCLEVCPQGAVIELVPISSDELKTLLASLKQKVGELVYRLDGLIVSEKER